MKSIHPRVILAVPRVPIGVLLARANQIHNAMTAASSTLTAPSPTMSVLGGFIQALDAAQQAAATRTAGLVATRDLRATDVMNALVSERGYVQGLVDAAPEQAAHIAGLASMSILASRTPAKPALALTLTQPPGTVIARANASLFTQGRTTSRARLYNWRYTIDGGKTYVGAPPTPVAYTTLYGLTPLTTYGVEVCVTDTTGTTPWSQTVSILVH